METHKSDDPLAVYVEEVGKAETLSKDEETKLFRELSSPGVWDEGQEIIARRLIEGHLAQVVDVAQNYSASGVPMLDLIQEGSPGLMNAVKSFAEKPIGDFTDYAATCIDDAIRARLGS